MTPLYRQNITRLGQHDILIASSGGAGQAIVGNVLLELGLNYVDAYTEELLPGGLSQARAEHTAYRQRLAATYRRDSASGPAFRQLWPRFVKTHYPAEVFASCELGGVWFLIRDPRDALYSLYRWRHSFAEVPWDVVPDTFEEWLANKSFDGDYPVEDWTSYYLDWFPLAQRYPAMAVSRFEDLKAKPLETFRNALRTFGVEVPESELREAIDFSSFESMRAHEDAVNASGGQDSGQRMVRQGKTDGWREWMTRELAGRFSSARTKALAARFGYAVEG
jgi:hypothetical protein